MIKETAATWINSLQLGRNREAISANVQRAIDKALKCFKNKTTLEELDAHWSERWWYDAPPLRIHLRDDEGHVYKVMLTQMPGCCGICIATGMNSYTGLWPEELAKFCESVAKDIGYSVVVWTHIKSIFIEAGRHGYTRDFEFHNSKSGNEVFLEHKAL